MSQAGEGLDVVLFQNFKLIIPKDKQLLFIIEP